MTASIFENTYTEDLYQLPPRDRIVLNKEWIDLNPTELDQLTRITEALRERVNPKMGLGHFEIITATTADLDHWTQGSARLICFGFENSLYPYYDIVQIKGCRIIFSEALGDLPARDNSKSKLWVSLKTLFTP